MCFLHELLDTPGLDWSFVKTSAPGPRGALPLAEWAAGRWERAWRKSTRSPRRCGIDPSSSTSRCRPTLAFPASRPVRELALSASLPSLELPSLECSNVLRGKLKPLPIFPLILEPVMPVRFDACWVVGRYGVHRFRPLGKLDSKFP